MTTQNVRIAPLKGHGTFDIVFEHGARFAYRGVTGFILFRHTLAALKTSLPDTAKFADTPANTVLVGVGAKRRTRPAAMRNRIKRILRAAVQNALWEANAMPFHGEREPFPIAAIVLICNIIPDKPSLLHLAEIQPLVERIFQNAERYYRSRMHSITEM
ncbi:MAG: ribonuclease P protein component [Candidatus Kapabacteria bacterium]|nr:ribonuclease P protein component [Candidatus Kapabacteria bacterium]